MPRYSHVPKIFAEAPDAVRCAFRDFREEKVKVGGIYKPKPIYTRHGLSDEQYVVAVGLHWNSVKSVGRKAGYPHVGVLVVCKPTDKTAACTVRTKRYEQISRRYDLMIEELPDWINAEKISEVGRRSIWDHNRTLFGALWPGESLTMAPVEITGEENQRVLKMEAREKSTPPVARPKPEVLGPKTITVQANGVNVTGTRAAIRALLFDEE